MNDEIEKLAAAVAAADAAAIEVSPAPAQGQEQAEKPEMTQADEIATALQLGSQILAPMFPSIGPIYTDDTCARVGEVVGAVFVKRGWKFSLLIWAEEIAAALVIMPLAQQTYAAVLHDLKAAEKKQKDGKDDGEGADVEQK